MKTRNTIDHHQHHQNMNAETPLKINLYQAYQMHVYGKMADFGCIEQKFTRNFPNNSGKSSLYYMKPTKPCKVKFHCIICTMHINGDICSIYSQNLLKHNHIVCSFVSSTHQAMYMMYN